MRLQLKEFDENVGKVRLDDASIGIIILLSVWFVPKKWEGREGPCVNTGMQKLYNIGY